MCLPSSSLRAYPHVVPSVGPVAGGTSHALPRRPLVCHFQASIGAYGSRKWRPKAGRCVLGPPADTERDKHHRFPGDIISHGVWLSSRFTLRSRDVEELLCARGIMVSHEAIRPWCRTCGQDDAHRLRRRRPQPGASASAADARSMGAMALTRSNNVSTVTCMALRALLLLRMWPTEHLLRGASAPGVRASALPSLVSSPPAARARRESSRAACRGAVAGGAHGAAYHSCTGVRMGAPVAFSSTTTTLAGAVVLALRPTTCTSVGPS